MNFLTSPSIDTLVWVDITKCKACDICVSLCPCGTLAMVQDTKSTYGSSVEIIDEKSCIGCRDCELHCPDFAIYVNERSSEVKFSKLTEEAKQKAEIIKQNNYQKVGA